jgi:DNA-binding GntR family transcriptional regulator
MEPQVITLKRTVTLDAGTPRRWSPGRTSVALSVAEQISERLSASIIEGAYQPGERLYENQISDSFGVSRGPIREALRILEMEGLVEILPRRGARVTDLSIEEINDIFEIRTVLLGLAARQTCVRNDPAVASELVAGAKRLTSLTKSDKDLNEYVNSTYMLNLYMAESSGNEPLRSMIFSLARQTLRYAMLGLSTRERRLQSAKNWRRLANAIKNHDPEKAEAEAKALVNDSRSMAIRMLDQQIAEKAD